MQRYYSLKKTIDANVRVITHTYMLFAYVITFDYSSHTNMLFVQDIITHMYTSAQVTFHINSLHINVTCSFNSVMSSLYTKLCTIMHPFFVSNHEMCAFHLYASTLSRQLCTCQYLRQLFACRIIASAVYMSVCQERHISVSNVCVFSFCFNFIHATF